MDLGAFCRAIPKVALQARLLDGVPLPQGPGDLHRIAYERLEDAAAQGVRHAEIAWSPAATARDSGIPYAAAAEAILAGFDDAKHDHGIAALLIPSIDRDASPEQAVEMVGWMTAHRRDRIAGLGLEGGPPERFSDACRAARRAGFRLAAHAGTPGEVAAALDLLEAGRIHHGHAVLDDPALARRCAGRGIVFTVSPDHPVRRMAAAGLLIHPEAPHRADLCWHRMAEAAGFDLDDLRRFMLNGIHGAFLPEEEKHGLAATFSEEYGRLRAELEPAP